MRNTKRQNEILTLLQENYSMSVEDIAKHFYLTPTSIRRDLAYLESNKFITRSRGYAHCATYPKVSDFDNRNNTNNEEKQRIAVAAAKLIGPRESIIFDSGSSALALANEMKKLPLPNMTIITNSIPIAIALGSIYSVMLSSGILNYSDMSLIGPDADRYFQSIIADKAFIGATGVNSTVGLTASSPFHVTIKQRMINASSDVIALLDSSKFSACGVNMFTEFSKISTIVTTHVPENEKKLQQLEDMGIHIIYA